MQIEWFFVVFMMNITFWLVHIVQTCQGNVASSLVVPDHDQCDCQSGRWKGTGKVSNQGCAWFESPVAYNYFAGGAGGDVTYKPVICPAGYIMTGTRMFGVSKSVDDEHVDAYCCPFS